MGDQVPRVSISVSEHAVSGSVASEHGHFIDLELVEILHAIGDGQVVPYYMPLVSLADGQLVGVEALARWHRPRHGDVVLPAGFVPRLERARRVSDLTAWMVDAVCADLVSWSRRYTLPAGFRVAVNVSATELIDHRLLLLVCESLQKHQVAAHLICLEITESAKIDDVPCAAAVLAELRALGVRVAVDDFGSGFAGPDYLVDFAVDAIKIDQLFVAQLANQVGARDFVARTVAHGQAHRMDVIAEGIETTEQASTLRTMGCWLGQGFGLGLPAPGDCALDGWLPSLLAI